jgi:integrase
MVKSRKLEYTFEAVNERLRRDRVKVSLYQRGDRLWLRATLPPKPGSDRPMSYQQKISLGLPANEDGFKRAEGEARLLRSLLTSKEFDWRMYLSAERLPENKPSAKWIEEFRSHYMETHSLKESTWVNQWQKVYGRLPANDPLTAELMTTQALATERDTRNRKETCRKLQALADFAGVRINLLQYQGKYGASKVKARELPTDEAIARWWNTIPNPQWKWIFGVMASMGLRDHECFFCHWTDDGLFVEKGKTGERLVFEAFYPEWVEQWELKNIQRPNIQNIEQLYEDGKLGDKVARAFRRYKIPFSPYDLRHAFGIRASLRFGLHPTTAAALMGHSPEIHLKRYHRHVTRAHNQEVVRRIINDPDRPKPPL